MARDHEGQGSHPKGSEAPFQGLETGSVSLAASNGDRMRGSEQM